MKPAPASADGRTYAREIERAWSLLQDRPVVLSPKDWALITDWHARGVPLSLIHEAMQAARDNARALPRGLSYLAPAIEEAFWLVLDGRRRAAPVPLPAAEEASSRWRRVEREHADSPLGRLVRELLERLEAGEEPAAVDERLDHALPGSVDPAVLSDITRAVETELAPFAERMGPETLRATVRSAVVFRLRRQLGLPGLARGC